MKNNWTRALVVASILIFSAACGSKKKAGDGVSIDGSPDAAISAKEMTFDSTGSDSGKISGLNTIFFDYDQASITAQARQQLAQNAEWIKSNSNVAIQIEGHCDARGTVEYNIALGERRALSVKNYLVGLGIDGKRLSVISYGKERPMEAGDTEMAYSKNRRANFVPVPK
jgi:peptidoglycan-associated lipoprotein